MSSTAADSPGHDSPLIAPTFRVPPSGPFLVILIEPPYFSFLAGSPVLVSRSLLSERPSCPPKRPPHCSSPLPLSRPFMLMADVATRLLNLGARCSTSMTRFLMRRSKARAVAALPSRRSQRFHQQHPSLNSKLCPSGIR